MKTITLKKYLHILNLREESVDLYVDGIDGIAVCAPVRLTEAGWEKFGSIMDMEVEGDCILGTDEDYDAMYEYEDDEREDGGRLYLAWEFLKSLAGYCSCSDFDRWFEGGKEI